MSKVTDPLESQDCHVCGQGVHPKFLSAFNGVAACKYCIKHINEEADNYDSTDHH